MQIVITSVTWFWNIEGEWRDSIGKTNKLLNEGWIVKNMVLVDIRW